MTFEQLPLLPHSEKSSEHTSTTRHTLAMSLEMNIELGFFVCCALESALWQRLSTIKVELELELLVHP